MKKPTCVEQGQIRPQILPQVWVGRIAKYRENKRSVTPGSIYPGPPLSISKGMSFIHTSETVLILLP